MTPGYLALVAAALLVLAADPALLTAPAGDGGPISRRGTYAGGRYVIEVPARWNGGLVVFAHGYRGTEYSPLASHLTANGYAWAASSFRSDGYRPDWFLVDTLQVRDLFIREVGRPRWTIIHGQAMGGHVAIASLELHPGVYQGALIECGAIDGVGIVDFYLAYKAAAEYFAGVPLLDAMDRPDLPGRISERWLPVLGQPDSYTAQGRRFDSVIKYLFGGDLPLLGHGLRQHYITNLLVPVHMTEPLGRAGSTLHIRFRIDPALGVDEDELNRKIRRFAPAEGARSREADPVFAELTGRITVPVLAIHETGDARVPFSLQQAYRRRTLAAGTSHLLVQRAVRWGRPLWIRGRAARASLRRPRRLDRTWGPTCRRRRAGSRHVDAGIAMDIHPPSRRSSATALGLLPSDPSLPEGSLPMSDTRPVIACDLGALSEEERTRRSAAAARVSDEIVSEMQSRRERYGISYHVVSDRSMEAVAPIVARLAGL